MCMVTAGDLVNRLDASCFSIKQILCIVKPKSKGITETRGVSHCGLAIYIKTYLNAKEEL